LPIITVCPENNLPDLVYVTVETKEFLELYAVRKKIKRLLRFKCLYMEAAAAAVLSEYPEASAVEVRLLFNRHVVRIENENA